MNDRAISLYSKDFLDRIAELKKSMHKRYADISATPTPQYDGSGNLIIQKRPDGYDYLEELYMRTKLDELFPGWSWEGLFTQFVAYEWIWVGGHLVIIDEYLLAFQIIPPIRKFYATGAARIMFKSCPCKKKTGYPIAGCEICHGTGELPHTPENVIDISNNIKSADSSALKFGINRLCRIGDDVYGKRLDEEGGGSLEDIMANVNLSPNVARDVFLKELTKKKMLHSEVMKKLGISSWNEIRDWQEVWNKIFGKGDE